MDFGAVHRVVRYPLLVLLRGLALTELLARGG